MTRDNVRKAAEFLRMLEEVKDWRMAFEEDDNAKTHPFIEFADISAMKKVEGDGQGWNGSLTLPRNLAIEMMVWLEQRMEDELAKLEVEK